MKAAVIQGIQELLVDSVPTPSAAPGEAVVRLRAAALNPADIFFRQLGGYVSGPAPLVLGHDGMGVVREIGAGVTLVKPGERVCFCHGGIGGNPYTYAQPAGQP